MTQPTPDQKPARPPPIPGVKRTGSTRTRARTKPIDQPALMMASIVLADEVYGNSSRRLQHVLGASAVVLFACVLVVARLQPLTDPSRGWLHPPCPIASALSLLEIH
jgi:hypothetical protein